MQISEPVYLRCKRLVLFVQLSFIGILCLGLFGNHDNALIKCIVARLCHMLIFGFNSSTDVLSCRQVLYHALANRITITIFILINQCVNQLSAALVVPVVYI